MVPKFFNWKLFCYKIFFICIFFCIFCIFFIFLNPRRTQIDFVYLTFKTVSILRIEWTRLQKNKLNAVTFKFQADKGMKLYYYFLILHVNLLINVIMQRLINCDFVVVAGNFSIHMISSLLKTYPSWIILFFKFNFVWKTLLSIYL